MQYCLSFQKRYTSVIFRKYIWYFFVRQNPSLLKTHNYPQIQPWPDLSNPGIAKIDMLEKQYSKLLADGEVFKVLKEVRTKINLLKAELGIEPTSIKRNYSAR